MSDEDIKKEWPSIASLSKPVQPIDSPQDQSKNDLKKAVKESNEILITASTISPIHRITVSLSRSKLVIEERSGLRSVAVTSVRIEDVLNVNGEVGPISGFINISTKFTPPGNPNVVGPFRRKDVIRLKRIMQGYVLALQKDIKLTDIPTQEMIPLLYELGEDDPSIR